ncbi:MAG: nitroreductase family deazaflavin-dependent oxidoreductase [Ktedonobacterales bacterium]|nr:nitroreductase family deazaflavin-dependent oxidoreductase [Ktedonobacterales bacterium]
MSPLDWIRYAVSTRAPALIFPTHRLLLRLTGGRLLATSGRMPVLLLTTTGRKTGQPRTWPLAYLRDGEALVLVASNSGRDHSPAWYLNLLANSQATIQIGGVTRRVRAETASPAEKARLWPLLIRCDPLYAAYQRRTARAIPVVLLRDGDLAACEA